MEENVFACQHISINITGSDWAVVLLFSSTRKYTHLSRMRRKNPSDSVSVSQGHNGREMTSPWRKGGGRDEVEFRRRGLKLWFLDWWLCPSEPVEDKDSSSVRMEMGERGHHPVAVRCNVGSQEGLELI